MLTRGDINYIIAKQVEHGMLNNAGIWGLSSAGRASALQAEGHRFEPYRPHFSINKMCIRDRYTPALLDLGLGAMIGKGKRTKAVQEAIVRNSCVYFAAVGGAGALLSQRIKASQVVAYDDLGTEAIRKLEVEDFPVIVVIDSQGNNLYETAVKEYAE